jgi:hypothetical protein
MVLDAYKTVYIWVGLQSNKHERLNAIKKVESYVQALSDGRDPKDVQIV